MTLYSRSFIEQLIIMTQATAKPLFSLRTILVAHRTLFRIFIEVGVQENLKMKATYEPIQMRMYSSSSNINL